MKMMLLDVDKEKHLLMSSCDENGRVEHFFKIKLQNILVIMMIENNNTCDMMH